MRLLAGVCISIFVFMLDALVLDSQAFAQATSDTQTAGPRFRADGPNADVWDHQEGYPSCKGIEYIDQTRCRVGALSRYNAVLRDWARVVERSCDRRDAPCRCGLRDGDRVRA
jgi:hypothetical protein